MPHHLHLSVLFETAFYMLGTLLTVNGCRPVYIASLRLCVVRYL